jgi:hypothetical protein
LCRVRNLLLTDGGWHADRHRHGHALLAASLEHLRCRKLLRHLFLLMCMDHLHLLLQHHLLVLHGQLLLHWSGRLGSLPIATRRRARVTRLIFRFVSVACHVVLHFTTSHASVLRASRSGR